MLILIEIELGIDVVDLGINTNNHWKVGMWFFCNISVLFAIYYFDILCIIQIYLLLLVIHGNRYVIILLFVYSMYLLFVIYLIVIYRK